LKYEFATKITSTAKPLFQGENLKHQLDRASKKQRARFRRSRELPKQNSAIKSRSLPALLLKRFLKSEI
ncbi:hypothetical protein, partial [uncultured Campylobacter sp.]|uniref:hypothetical protein n=1 Tax=uncultured Campylobacter sp. TaxID=218934 RepID=UPI0026273E5E